MKIKLNYTGYQRFLEVIAILILISMILSLAIRWEELPNQIPGHYNIAGEVDRWGNKSELIILPIFSIMLYVLFTVLTFFPSTWNIPYKVTDRNREKVYGCIKTMMIMMKAEMMALFLWINMVSMEAKSLTPFFLPIMFGVIFGTIIYYFVKASKLSKIF